MPNSPRYLFDSDVLITSKNIHYQPTFCAPFWDWIVAGHDAGVFFSVDKVKAELLNGKKSDPLHAWCAKSELAGFFLDTKPCMSKWGDLAKWVMDPARPYVTAAKDKFLHVDSADAWLIAYAAQEGNFEIITHEMSAPDSRTSVKIPDAAKAMGVNTILLHQCLSKHATGVFKFKP